SQVSSNASEDILSSAAGAQDARFTLPTTQRWYAVAGVFRAGGATGDSQAPSVPTGLAGSAPSANQVNLSWSASTDNVGVSGYTVYRGGHGVGTVGGTTLSYSDETVAPSTTCSYAVDAFDAAGNHSAPSAAASVATAAATDTQAPSVPAGLAGSAPGAN